MLSELVADAVGILDVLGIERAHLVGHDWGAALGWAIAALAPDRVTRSWVLAGIFHAAIPLSRPSAAYIATAGSATVAAVAVKSRSPRIPALAQ